MMRSFVFTLMLGLAAYPLAIKIFAG